jgi:transglutaminase-like putative cysteine protease
MADSQLEISPISRDARIRFAAYVGMLAAYLAAVKNDPLTPFQLAFFGAAAAWSLGFEHRFRKPFFSAPIKIALIVLGSVIFVLFISGYARGGTEDFANSIARFLFWNAIVFVLSRNKSEYDLWTLAIIELSLFMISGAFVQPPGFLPLLLTSVASLLYTFQRTAILRCGAAGEAEKGGLGLTLVTLLLVLEGAAVVFVGFPRHSFRSERSPEAGARDRAPLPPEGPAVSTGGDRVGIPQGTDYLKLTNFDKLKADPRPVLRIRVRDLKDQPVPPDQTLYLRGAVYALYEGGEWVASTRRERRRDADDGKLDDWTELEPNRFPGRTVVRQQIRMNPLPGDLSFVLPDPVRVSLKDVRYDPAGTVFFAAPLRDVIEYYVESALQPADPPRVKQPPPAPDVFLQIPPGLERLRDTARRQTERAANQMHAKVAALQHYLLRNGFSYKLGPFVPAAGKDPVEYFLEKREGYCTHYATALALLCRAVGIPTRVATGFQLHDPEPDGSFRVRNSDAHAWVEVWYGPEEGWRAYDATPPEGRAPPPAEGDPVASVENRKAEEGAGGPPRRWDHFIVDYDPKSQSLALSRTLSALARALEGAARALTSGPVLGGIAALAAAAALAYVFLPGRQRRRLRQIVGGFRDPTTVDFYRDFLWALARRGIRKHPAWTPREFARQIRGAVPEADLDFLTLKFYETRYRGTPPSADERRRLDAIVASLLKRPADA